MLTFNVRISNTLDLKNGFNKISYCYSTSLILTNLK